MSVLQRARRKINLRSQLTTLSIRAHVHRTGPLIMVPCAVVTCILSSSKVETMSPDHRAAECFHVPAQACCNQRRQQEAQSMAPQTNNRGKKRGPVQGRHCVVHLHYNIAYAGQDEVVLRQDSDRRHPFGNHTSVLLDPGPTNLGILWQRHVAADRGTTTTKHVHSGAHEKIGIMFLNWRISALRCPASAGPAAGCAAHRAKGELPATGQLLIKALRLGRIDPYRLDAVLAVAGHEGLECRGPCSRVERIIKVLIAAIPALQAAVQPRDQVSVRLELLPQTIQLGQRWTQENNIISPPIISHLASAATPATGTARR
eukprot:SAG31_NODE_993_length_10512_cov_20.777202_3_plen_316_part_00